MPQTTAARQNMVQSQLQPNGVLTPTILGRFETVPREAFVPANLKPVAYTDTALSILGRSMLPPLILARMIEAAQPQPFERACVVGAMSGYGATILAGLTQTVTAWECDTTFKSLADAAPIPGNVTGTVAPFGTPAGPTGPFDVIIVEGAVAEPPTWLFLRLAPAGRLITVLQSAGSPIGTVTLFEKTALGHISSRPWFDATATYLPGCEPAARFNWA